MRVEEQTLGLARAERVGFGCGVASAAAEGWLGTQESLEIQDILRQNEMAFRLFVAASMVICALILAAMFLA